MKRRGRPPKYKTETERQQARRTSARERKRRAVEERRFHEGLDLPDRPPPPEVYAERDYRMALVTAPTMPPQKYAGHYYETAWWVQRMFARGEL